MRRRTASTLLASARRKWKAVGAPNQDPAETRLLRLSVLRELSRGLHSAVSGTLAGILGTTASAREEISIRALLERVERLRDADLSLELDEGLSGAPAKVSAPEVPGEVLSALGADRLERDDRKWERALAAQAAAARWGFWALEAAPHPAEAQVFHQRLSRALGRLGILLYVETVPRRADELWRGRWVVALSPAIREPAGRLKGVIESAHGEWKRLWP